MINCIEAQLCGDHTLQVLTEKAIQSNHEEPKWRNSGHVVGCTFKHAGTGIQVGMKLQGVTHYCWQVQPKLQKKI